MLPLEHDRGYFRSISKVGYTGFEYFYTGFRYLILYFVFYASATTSLEPRRLPSSAMPSPVVSTLGAIS